MYHNYVAKGNVLKELLMTQIQNRVFKKLETKVSIHLRAYLSPKKLKTPKKLQESAQNFTNGYLCIAEHTFKFSIL